MIGNNSTGTFHAHYHHTCVAAAAPTVALHCLCPPCSAGMGRWDQAVQYYTQASQLAPEFSFAAANRALALYQSGSQEPAIR
jgi:hypothetical protein